MFTKILIANRGEIACRVIETAKKMGIATVAVFSDADRNAKFVTMAEEAIYIGQSESSESYLCIDKILTAARQTGCQAIHPGYGFLSENAEFANRCKAENVVFIGPPVDAIQAMGSKSQAKALMEKAGVPLVPGYHGEDQSYQFLHQQADAIGYPVLLKASAGGGGKGMRVVDASSSFEAAFKGAKRESLASFGDDKLLIEKYIKAPRHVEIQVFFDNHGNGVYLFERDCSIQRRHQKVIEEAPAPNISASTRVKMGKAAIECARSINYTGAGTVEFLLDADESFYFMEMNTRLQVEHPVTEMITGVDLVEWQLRVANNEPLPLGQDQLKKQGHSFEVRIYAEDPYNQFLPATGKIRHLSCPQQTANVRIDSGIRENDAISAYYDPMIAKLIVWGETRQLAINRMKTALNQYQLSGMPNNIGFVSRIFAHPAFASADLTTGFIANYEAELLAQPMPSNDAHLLAAIKTIVSNLSRADSTNKNPWHSKVAWRLNQSNTEHFDLIYAGEEIRFEVLHSHLGELGRDASNLSFDIKLRGLESEFHRVTVAQKPEHFGDAHPLQITATIDGHMFHFNAHRQGDLIDLFYQNHCLEYTIKRPVRADAEMHNANSLLAPMHGKIIALNIKQGEFVEKGQILVVMEAMKMEHSIQAPKSGIVVECHCQAGDRVEEGFELIEISDD